MADRADAFLATAKIEVLLDSLAREKGAVATVGIIEHGEQASGSSNTIPGSAQFTIDLRSPSEKAIVEITAELQAEMRRLEQENLKLVSRFLLGPRNGGLAPDNASVLSHGTSLAQPSRKIRSALARLPPKIRHGRSRRDDGDDFFRRT